jgi:FecR protein
MWRKDMRRKEEDIAKLFKKSLPSAQQEVEAGKRVFYRLLLARAESPAGPLPNDDENGHGRKWLRLSIAIAATTALASFLFIPFLTSGLWETGGNILHTEPSGDPIRRGETVSASNPEGRMLVLPDGSQVEMRSQSQLQVEHADDGLRVRLNTGSIIVTAAKQRTGHLYIETKDAMVSVVGTVFVVTVEQSGSRVGVFEGVVNVQYGAMSQPLSWAQQMATNPTMEPVPLEVQVSWSRNLASLLALLRPALPPVQPLAPAAAPAAPPQSQLAAASQNTQEPDSLLIIGGAGNRAARPPAPTAEAEQAMEQALKSREVITELALLADTNYFQLNRAEYFVPVTLKIPGTQLEASGSTKHILLDILGEAIDGNGTLIVNFRDAVDVSLSDEKAKELPMRQIAYEIGFTLLPGPYSIKFLVHDRNTGRIGTYQTALVVPNLFREGNLPISSVVLSSELINTDDALSNSVPPRSFSAGNPSGVDPLLIEGKKLIPGTTRTFSKRRDLIVFLEAYELNATATEPLTASVALYRGQTKVFETAPITVKDEVARKFKTLPVTLRVPLATLPVGAYDCQVTVLNPATQKSAVWRSSINLVN